MAPCSSPRAVQGAAAALLLTVYTDEGERSRAIGIFTATLTAGAAAGLILDGALTTELGWRRCLYVNVAVPLAVTLAGP